MKIGLVLGAGGIQGGAWLTGGLDALAAQTGWDPAEADYVVGTSAGSMIGALCASGIPPWFMVAHSRGEVFEGVVDADGRPAAEADRAGGARFQLERALPPIGPGSWRLALRTLANPRRFTPATVFTGWIPRGIFSTESLKDTVARFLPYWSETIAPKIRQGARIIIAAHGNSLRALIKYLDAVSDEDIVGLNIPTGIPLVYELDAGLRPVRHYYLGDPAEAEAKARAVAGEARART